MRPRLTYANVVATLALFIAIGGASAFAASQLGKNSVGSKQLKKNSVTSAKIKKNAVTGAKIKSGAVTGAKLTSGTITRAQIAGGTLAGLQVGEFQAPSVPGVNISPPSTTPVPLTGTTSFTPAAGKTYQLLLELKGNPIDADGAGGQACVIGAFVSVNGNVISTPSIAANTGLPGPFGDRPVATSQFPLGLLSPGQPQTLSVVSTGSEDCGPGTSAALRGVVIELG